MKFRTSFAVALAGAAMGLATQAANAQVVINEVFENPPGGTDERWEYIELYGRPGMDLSGYAIGLLKGGSDSNDDDIPDGDPEERIPEIDESFTLDGCQIGPNGFFVLYNRNAFGSAIEDFLILNPDYNSGVPETPSNREYLNGLSFRVAHITASLDTQGKLANDNSSSYVLVRRRPNHMLDGNGMSMYLSGYAFGKDFRHDVNFDGKTDFGTETPIPTIGESPSEIEPFQMVDDVAWSNGGGKEYVLDSQQEISETPGYNPDGISRINFFLENPMIGHRTRDLAGGAFEIVPTRTADEEWVHGDVRSVSGANALQYDSGVDSDGFIQYRSPTDVNAVPFDGSCDPDPDDEASDGSCVPNAGGTFFITNLNLDGFAMTPGDFNDFNGGARGASSVMQYRFVRGDFNFDGMVDAADLSLIEGRANATLDDTVEDVYDNGTPENFADDVMFDRYIWQGRGFQQTLMMLDTDMADGEGGMNAEFVTMADIQAVRDLVPVELCLGDCDGSGAVDFNDLVSMLFEFGNDTGDACDADGSGTIDFNDLVAALFAFGPCK